MIYYDFCSGFKTLSFEKLLRFATASPTVIFVTFGVSHQRSVLCQSPVALWPWMVGFGVYRKKHSFLLPAAKRHGHAELWVEKKRVMGILVFESLSLLFLVFFESDFSIFFNFQKNSNEKI